jgi:hypothetical protein
MKKILSPAIIAIIVLLSCKKENTTAGMVDGIITGPDLAMCPCCGGTFIKIADTVFRIESVPASSGIDLLNGPFPINVALTYRIDSLKCVGKYIKSDDIRRR